MKEPIRSLKRPFNGNNGTHNTDRLYERPQNGEIESPDYRSNDRRSSDSSFYNTGNMPRGRFPSESKFPNPPYQSSPVINTGYQSSPVTMSPAPDPIRPNPTLPRRIPDQISQGHKKYF